MKFVCFVVPTNNGDWKIIANRLSRLALSGLVNVVIIVRQMINVLEPDLDCHGLECLKQRLLSLLTDFKQLWIGS